MRTLEKKLETFMTPVMWDGKGTGEAVFCPNRQGRVLSDKPVSAASFNPVLFPREPRHELLCGLVKQPGAGSAGGGWGAHSTGPPSQDLAGPRHTEPSLCTLALFSKGTQENSRMELLTFNTPW